MKLNTEQPKVPESKPKTPKSNVDAKDDLQTLPMTELEKKLESSSKGLTQAEAQKRLTQYGPNEIEEKKTKNQRVRNWIIQFLTLWLNSMKREAARMAMQRKIGSSQSVKFEKMNFPRNLKTHLTHRECYLD
jgi:magnesium-transporting ATPase (P-type)